MQFHIVSFFFGSSWASKALSAADSPQVPSYSPSVPRRSSLNPGRLGSDQGQGRIPQGMAQPLSRHRMPTMSVPADFKNIGQGNDNLIFLLTLKNYSSFGYINDVLVYFRSHDSSITINSDSLMVNLRYHIAKAYFIDLTNLNIKLINNFNMKYKLLSILVKLKFKKYYGISNLYSKNKNINTNFLFTFILLYRYFINIFYIKDRN